MNPKYYCPVCHKRIEKPIWTGTVWSETGEVHVTYYQANHTEPICNGQCVQVTVPQVFYDALTDEDVRL